MALSTVKDMLIYLAQYPINIAVDATVLSKTKTIVIVDSSGNALIKGIKMGHELVVLSLPPKGGM